MNQYSYETNKQLLEDLMRQVNIADIYELSEKAGVARLPILRIQRGLILNVSVGAIAKIAQALNISVDSLIDTFSEQYQGVEKAESPTSDNIFHDSGSGDRDALAACKQEYQKLRQEMLQQQELLEAEFQRSSIETIESWLLQWPTAAMAVHKNPNLPAARLISLVEPVEQLLKQWNVTSIATVGEKVAYDPKYHQLIKGTAEKGALVEVRYVGYKQEDKLLYKAKVSSV